MSYIWQDAEPARCIADALRAAGSEEWLDQSDEDYTRLECKLAADRTQDTCA